jgi:hypothetical protein
MNGSSEVLFGWIVISVCVVVVIEFDGGNSLLEQLALMWNPKAYRLQNQ